MTELRWLTIIHTKTKQEIKTLQYKTDGGTWVDVEEVIEEIRA